jgi:hypothetical protein
LDIGITPVSSVQAALNALESDRTRGRIRLMARLEELDNSGETIRDPIQ